MTKIQLGLAKGQPFGKAECSMCHTQSVARSASKRLCGRPVLGGSCRWCLGPGAEILGHRWKLKREAGEERGEEGGAEQGDALEQVPEEKINMDWRQLTL